MFVIVAALIVLMYPRYTNSFRYHYEVGKPWGHNALTADFDFPIYKTDRQIADEQKQLLSTFTPYYRYIPRVQKQVLVVSHQDMDWMTEQGYNSISLMQNNISRIYLLSDLYTPKSAYEHFGYECVQNLKLDTALTLSMREKLLTSLSPTQGMVQKGERIIDHGEIVTDRTYQILQSLARAYENDQIGNRQRALSILGEAILVALFLGLFVIYLYVFRIHYLSNMSMVLFFNIIMLIVAGLACLVLRFDISVYLIPFAWVPILTRVFFDSRTALFLHFATILCVSVVVPAPVEFFFVQIVVGMVAVSSLNDMTRRAQLVQTSAWIFLAQVISYTAIIFAQTGAWYTIDPWVYLHFFICALLTIGCYGLIYAFEKVFHFISSITLVELTDINSELLHKLAECAPGTFQHSMQVSNLATEAAKTIGANALLVRTGALYHDIGKLESPIYFTENQNGGISPHSTLTPIESAQAIIKHVTNGLSTAEHEGLPKKIREFITTHHGLSKTGYFYITYKNEHPNEPVDEKLFTYPGPRPFTKEQAVLMLADCVEAASHSLKEYTEENISKLVDNIVGGKLNEGELTMSPITFQDIHTIKEVFKKRLMAIYHTRISYPTEKKQ
jgi:putative nucleotidyltransferase with HDIG domain